jgi:hypothetical protein
MTTEGQNGKPKKSDSPVAGKGDNDKQGRFPKITGASNQARSRNPGNGSTERYLADAPFRERGSSTASVDQEPEGSGLPFSEKQILDAHASIQIVFIPWLSTGLVRCAPKTHFDHVDRHAAGHGARQSSRRWAATPLAGESLFWVSIWRLPPLEEYSR